MSLDAADLQSFRIEGMDCASCARSIEEGVRRLPGVDHCELNFSSERLRVRGSVEPEAVAARVRELGFSARSAGRERTPSPSESKRPGLFSYLMARSEGRMAAAAGILILPGLIWSELLGHSHWTVDLMSLAALGLAGWPVARSAARSLLVSRDINMNVLMTIAAVGAAVIGAYVEAGMVMVLFALGEILEGYTASRARDSIRRLLLIAPERAWLLKGAGQEPTPTAVEDLRLGDRIVIKPGERIPMDGMVSSGSSSVNQAPITGESRLIDKEPGDEVFAGTLNGAGSLEVTVSRAASESTISRMIRLVEEAKEKRAPAQRFVDRFARIYTPLVVAAAALAAVLPPLVWGQPFWTQESGETGWLYRSLALLVVACPCALVISTPVSIISAISQAARQGVLFKGGASLEALSRVRSMAFDKTGTLTEGSPAVVRVRSAQCEEDKDTDCEYCDELVALASAVERRSEHPLARAVVDESIARGVMSRYPAAEAVQAQVGHGVSGHVNGREVYIASHKRFDEEIPHRDDHCSEATDQADLGRTSVMVSVEGRYSGYLSLADRVRASSREALKQLAGQGIRPLVMLTGDSASVASRVADQVGLTQVEAELLPEGKVKAVESLKRRHGAVAMVGDGINDTPALAAASVGIALSGSAGNTGQAMETSDITLLGDDLRRLPYALRLSRKAMRTVAANVSFSLGIKGAFLVLVAMGLGTMWMAVLADVGTSLLVTLNGMRLLRVGKSHLRSS